MNKASPAKAGVKRTIVFAIIVTIFLAGRVIHKYRIHQQ